MQHLTFIISLGNTTEDIQQLIAACETLVRLTLNRDRSKVIPQQKSAINYQQVISPREAYFAPTETVKIERAGDRLCGELICPYPPGIPLLMPGEIITSEAVEYLQQVLAAGGTITGCKDPTLQTLQTLK